jgi:hypothetical protein
MLLRSLSCQLNCAHYIYSVPICYQGKVQSQTCSHKKHCMLHGNETTFPEVCLQFDSAFKCLLSLRVDWNTQIDMRAMKMSFIWNFSQE